jgi:hypothetical protein
MFWAYKKGKEDKECFQNFSKEASWESYSWKNEEIWEAA